MRADHIFCGRHISPGDFSYIPRVTYFSETSISFFLIVSFGAQFIHRCRELNLCPTNEHVKALFPPPMDANTNHGAGLLRGNQGAAEAGVGAEAEEIGEATAEREGAAETEKKNGERGDTRRAGEVGGSKLETHPVKCPRAGRLFCLRRWFFCTPGGTFSARGLQGYVG